MDLLYVVPHTNTCGGPEVWLYSAGWLPWVLTKQDKHGFLPFVKKTVFPHQIKHIHIVIEMLQYKCRQLEYPPVLT